MSAASVLIVVAACAIGVVGARLLLKARGGQSGKWSWRDGGVDPDV